MEGAWPTRAVLACLAALALAAPAHASTTIGMVAPSDPDNCTYDTEFMQNTVGFTVGLTPSYDVGSAGVITSWSTRIGSSPGTGARLKVYRPTADPYTWTVVGESSAKVLAADSVNTFPTRIAVQPGDRIAIRTVGSNGGPCDFPGTTQLGPDYSVFSRQTPGSDPAAGDSMTLLDSAYHRLVNIAAVVEADTDGDGFGDDTQDSCPGVSGASNGCPPPVPAPPVAPAPPLPAPPVPLSVKARASRVQHVLKRHGIVIVVQPNLASRITGTATVSIPAAGKVMRFTRATRNVRANSKATLELRLSKSKLARVKRALRAHRKLFARAIVTTTASGSKPAVKRFKIRLKP